MLKSSSGHMALCDCCLKRSLQATINALVWCNLKLRRVFLDRVAALFLLNVKLLPPPSCSGPGVSLPASLDLLQSFIVGHPCRTITHCTCFFLLRPSLSFCYKLQCKNFQGVFFLPFVLYGLIALKPLSFFMQFFHAIVHFLYIYEFLFTYVFFLPESISNTFFCKFFFFSCVIPTWKAHLLLLAWSSKIWPFFWCCEFELQ